MGSGARDSPPRLGQRDHVILVTGHGAGTPVAPGDKDLVNGIIGKPFDFDQVAQAIAHATQKTVTSD